MKEGGREGVGAVLLCNEGYRNQRYSLVCVGGLGGFTKRDAGLVFFRYLGSMMSGEWIDRVRGGVEVFGLGCKGRRDGRRGGMESHYRIQKLRSISSVNMV